MKKTMFHAFYTYLKHDRRCSDFPTSASRLAAGRLCLMIASLSLAACGAVQNATDKAAEIALGTVGIKMPENPNFPKPTKNIRLRLEAARDLNSDETGQGLSAIVRLYKLKDRNAFLAAPYSAFGNADREKQAFGAELLDVHEVILTPGQRLELSEKMSAETAFLGVVTLFRAPDPKRWRFAFALAESEEPGITLGLHACAMTATSTAPSGMALNESVMLSSVKCR